MKVNIAIAGISESSAVLAIEGRAFLKRGLWSSREAREEPAGRPGGLEDPKNS
jgi:hypothetical protein